MNYGNDFLFSEEELLFSNQIFRFFARNLDNSQADAKDFLDFIPKITETEQVRLVHQIFEDILRTLIDPGFGATYHLQ